MKQMDSWKFSWNGALYPKLKTKLLFIFGEHLRAFDCCFLGVFIIHYWFLRLFLGVFNFHHWFLPLFFECFHCWLHLFMSTTFFTLTNFFLFLYRECYRFGRAFFLPDFFYLACDSHIYHSTASATDLRYFLLTDVYNLPL